MNFPAYLAFDPSGNLWVTDQGNNRVLEFAAPFSTGQDALRVIGQENFTSLPPGIDRNCDKPVRASRNSVRLERRSVGGRQRKPPGTRIRLPWIPAPRPLEDAAATMVIGQTSLNSPSAGLNGYAIAFDPGGNLWVSDGISGVSEYTAPLSTGEAGTQMIGPKTVADNGTSPGSKLEGPQGLRFDSGRPVARDYDHGRVLRYGSTATPVTTTSTSRSTTTSSTSAGESQSSPTSWRRRRSSPSFWSLLTCSFVVAQGHGLREEK